MASMEYDRPNILSGRKRRIIDRQCEKLRAEGRAEAADELRLLWMIDQIRNIPGPGIPGWKPGKN